MNFSDHGKVLIMVSEAQDAEKDQREQAREAKLFITKRNGQWDSEIYQKLDGRFRGTFDLCTPIVDSITGEISQSDFTIRVSPSGGDSSKETADTLDGLIRNIRNISNAENAFQKAGRNCVIGGFDCIEIVQQHIDGDSWDQDLFIKHVPNAIDSVWFDLASTEQDRSDAQWAVKLIAIPASQYKLDYPDGGNQSISEDKSSNAYQNSADVVIIGQLYYRKPKDIELVLMSDGSVYQDDDDFKQLVDENAAKGITIALDDNGEEKRRTRKSWQVFSRLFDGGDWLAKEEATVFDYVPLVPVFGNYDIVENKTIYSGKIENLYDQQRVLNYALSRDIEDGALSAKAKYWGTAEQIEGYEDTIQTLNTNNDAMQLYNHEAEIPPPFIQGGVQVSQGLQTTVQNMQQMIQGSANSFNAMQGNANPMQSGVAGGQQIEQGQTGNIKWFKSLEVMIGQVGKILIKAIPKVYDATRQVRILQEDGTSSTVVLNQPETDRQTGEVITLNDLSLGDYDAVCEVGKAFNNQQKETAASFLEMAAIDPTIAQNGMDIWLKNQAQPGMDLMAERYREMLFNNDQIPDKQLTDEERQIKAQRQAQAQQQPPQPDPMTMAAQAEMDKAAAANAAVQQKAQQAQQDGQIKMASVQVDQDKINLDREKLQLDVAMFERSGEAKYNTEMISADQNQQKIDLQANKQMQEMAIKLTELEMQVGQQLNGEVQANMLTFNPQTGEFE